MKKLYKCKECGVTFDKYPILCSFCSGKEFEIKEKYKVKIIEEYSYIVEVEADGSTEAFNKAKEIYEDYDNGGDGRGYCFVADATTHDNTRYLLID